MAMEESSFEDEGLEQEEPLSYSERPDWQDIEPLVVDDGQAVVSIQYKPEHSEALAYFRAIMAKVRLPSWHVWPLITCTRQCMRTTKRARMMGAAHMKTAGFGGAEQGMVTLSVLSFLTCIPISFDGAGGAL